MRNERHGGENEESELAEIRHELTTPLAAVIGYAELLIEDARDLGYDGFLGVLNEVHRAGRLALNQVKELVQPAAFSAGAGWEDVRERMAAPLSTVRERTAHLLGRARREAPELLRDLESLGASSSVLDACLHSLAVDGVSTAGARDDSSSVTPRPRLPVDGEARGSVLVVDDHGANRDLLARHLEKEGYRVVLVDSGPTALEELATDGGFDLVILDILMPDMDGYEVLQKIKRSGEAFSRVPVILISALDDMKSVVQGIRLGAEDYLPRPFAPDLLKARVEKAIEKKRLEDKMAGEGGDLGEDQGQLGLTFRRMSEEIHRREERLKRLKYVRGS